MTDVAVGEPSQPALRFEWREDIGRLLAFFDPIGEPCPLDRESMLAAIAAGGWQSLYCSPEALDRFAGLAAAAAQPFFLEIAERRDGRCDIVISDDAMTAKLTLVPPYGGVPMRRAQVDAALREAGVIFGLIDSAIDEAIEQGECSGRVIARGRLPVSGSPARFTSLIPAMSQRGPRANARGLIDYRSLNSLVIVHAGDALMRRTPPTPGVHGEDVKGLILPANAGQDTPFAANLSGAVVNADDPELLSAAVSGQPILQADGVCVEPTITLPAVDLSSGHIDFDGTVKVTGDVASGMRLHATGDVFISGTVEAAEIEAGGNIVVALGVIGVADMRTGLQRARLTAKGSIQVRFCENAVLEAGIDLVVEETSLHCSLTALNTAVVGLPGKRRPHLIGGETRATAQLAVESLGSNGGVKTRVQLGFHPHLHDELGAVLRDIDGITLRLEELRKVLVLTDGPAAASRQALREKAQRTLESLSATHEQMLAKATELEAELKLVEGAQLRVGAAVYPGVEVQLGLRQWKTIDPLGPGVLQLVEGEAVYTPA